jgi:lysophospholipase L1-like esterase
MNRIAALRFLPQALLSGSAVVLTIWLRLSPAIVIAMTFLAVELTAVSRRQHASRLALVMAWGCTLLIAGGIFWAGKVQVLESSGAVLGLLNAAAILLASRQLPDNRTRIGWKLLGITWAFAVGFILVGRSYAANLALPFYLGLLLNALLLVLCKLIFRMPTFAIQTANTLLLLLFGLPVADLITGSVHKSETHLDAGVKYYSYDHAQKDPDSYALWTGAFLQQVGSVLRHVTAANPPGDVVPRHMVPHAQASLFQSHILINSHGFRGPEITEPKDNVYRIVALGESTTFGLTLTAEHRPWPELLQQMIRDRIKPERPVEVINAGFPSFDLKQNLYRLPGQILPLKPDMIISYHGYNGFHLIEKTFPMTFVDQPPYYRPRPLWILADCEYRLKLVRFKRQQGAGVRLHPPTFNDPLKSEYAAAYRELIDVAATNDIRLVLADYSMAVNLRSEPKVIEFYRGICPLVHWQIKANEVHSKMVRELARQNPEICFVSTHPHLDGENNKFIDLMHFDPDGERQLAETMFEGIKETLERDLSVRDRKLPTADVPNKGIESTALEEKTIRP